MRLGFIISSIVLACSMVLSACTEKSPTEGKEASAQSERKIQYWVAPMDANYRRDGPGKSPMGMDLIPVYADANEDANTVKISPAVVNNLGVRTALAERGQLWRRINTVGYVDFDETGLIHVHSRTDGWIERLYVSSEGESVRKGDRLFDLYSPTLVNAQEEYVQALGTGNRSLMRASKERLVSLGLSSAQVDTLRKTRRVQQTVTQHAVQDGIVATLKVRNGMYIKPSTEVLSLADLSSVWLLAEVFESQTDWVSLGQTADIRLSYLPGREWEGKVEYIYPSLDPKTRTLKVRLRFDNPKEELKPNMYASVHIYGGAKNNVVTVPREALIRSGEGERVIVALGEGRFAAREVKAGIESGDWVEIAQGLDEGERVVVSGQFLIDSEASIKASMLRMSDAQAPVDESKPEASTQATDEPVVGMGIVRAVMPEHNMIKIAHEPIEVLGWGAMVMDFNVLEGVSIAGFKEGDAVRFELGSSADGFPITVIGKRAD